MSIKERVTVLYETAEEIGEHLEQNDNSLTIQADKGNSIVIQRRLVIENNSKLLRENESLRVTWRNKDRNTERSTNIITPSLNFGLNVYASTSVDTSSLKLNGDTNAFIETPKYNLLHSDELIDITELLNDVDISSFLEWNWNDNEYDIVINHKNIEIHEYSYPREGSSFTTTKTPAIEHIEAGIFYIDSVDKENVNLSGFRCLWDENSKIEKCIKTSLFHKAAFIPNGLLGENETASTPIHLETPVGLHPKILIDLSSKQNYDQCEYYLFSQLPLEIFVDKFQSEPVFVFGEHDLELPDYKLRHKGWGSETLFTLQPGEINEVILHSRYIVPEDSKSYRDVALIPQIFLACDSDSDDVVKNPFYVKGFGYESFFTANTVFQPLNSTELHVPIPSPDSLNYNNIKNTTLVCITLSIIYLFVKIFKSTKLVSKQTKEVSKKDK